MSKAVAGLTIEIAPSVFGCRDIKAQHPKGAPGSETYELISSHMMILYVLDFLVFEARILSLPGSKIVLFRL